MKDNYCLVGFLVVSSWFCRCCWFVGSKNKEREKGGDGKLIEGKIKGKKENNYMNRLRMVSKVAIMMVMLLVITAMTATGASIGAYWDLNAVELGEYTVDSDTTTNVFNNIVYESKTTTTYDRQTTGQLSVGDTFSTDTVGTVTWLCPATGSDTEGLNVEYEVTFVTSGLTGSIQSISDGTWYNEYTGGSLEMFVDTARNSDLLTGNGFNDGVSVAEINGITGSGWNMLTDSIVGNPKILFGGYNLSGESTYLLDNFWYDEYGNEINLLNLFLCESLIPCSYDQIFSENGNDYTISSYATGCVGVASTPVPEPASILLLGTGLVGLTGYGKSKRRKKK